MSFYLFLRSVAAGTLILISGMMRAAGPETAPNLSSWNLLVEGGKGESRRDPLCHKRQYFYGPPSQFDFDQDLSGKNPKDWQVKMLSRTVGTVAGRKVIQIEQDINDGETVMKRLVVQRHGSEFCAIYQQEYPASIVVVSLAKIIDVQGEPILMTRDENGARDLSQQYWTFDDQGPILLDLHVIDRALATMLPKGDESRGDYGLDIRALCYQNPVWKRDECDSCASGGTVAIKLAIKQHQLAVVRQQYDPAGRQANVPDSAACTP